MSASRTSSENGLLKDGYARLGWIKAEEKHWQAAFEVCQKDQELNRISPASKVNLAQLYGRMNKYGEAEKLIADAHLLEEAGCFALVVEKVPASLGERLSKEIDIPIGINAIF